MPTARPPRITRFTVMAMLQAARASRLGLTRPSAFSWGLNRAIFYAAAKRGFKGGGGPGGGGEGGGPGTSPSPEFFRLGDDEAPRDPSRSEPMFRIGGETQTEDAFLRQVASRFGSDANFRVAWSEAEAIVADVDEPTLRSRSGFFERVYRPRRDELSTKWAAQFGVLGPLPPRGAMRRSGPSEPPRTGR